MELVIEQMLLLTIVSSRKLARRLHVSERGEGVISTAVAVLVVAFLGILMYTLLSDVMTKASDKTNTEVGNIGGGTANANN
jgi:hypothetical protein